MLSETVDFPVPSGPIKQIDKLFLSFAKEMLGEKEFFIRTAIGWCLREMSKDDTKSAFDFIRENKGEMSRLTFREGSRNLPKELRDKL